MKKILGVFLILLQSCSSNSYSDLLEDTPNKSLNLKWNKAYQNDDIDKSVIGLKWALSNIGSKLPKNLKGINIINSTISIDINAIGLSENAIDKLNTLHQKIINSDEYQANKNIDLGRYVSLLLGASNHYYEIIGTPKTLRQLLNKYSLKPEKGYVNNSAVSLEHRIIQFSEQKGLDQVFLSQEVDPITQEIYEYETIELLPNGQLRFGIFDVNGNRITSADPEHSNAGKPAKCTWCHESSINPFFTPQLNFNGYLTAVQMQNKLLSFGVSHNNLKLNLVDGIDFSQTQQHTLTELLYISFMEPSAERLSLEWNLPLNQVQNLLSGLPTHVYDEFPFLGNLYYRNEIENIAPFQGLAVSTNVREKSLVEVNHLD